MAENSITLAGDLSKSATVLIEKISDAVGGLCKPWQTRRTAHAEADAKLIQATARLEIDELEKRALQRFVREEGQKQANMEAIVSKALSDVVDEEGASRLSDDWITNFFDHARLISDPEMQELWARILAGEANTPGSFSRHTINIMRDLDKADAQLFQRLCSFGWTIGKFRIILPYSIQHIADSMGLDGAALRHFEVLGLALYERDEFLCTHLSHSQTAMYFNQRVELNLTHGSIPVGPAVLTRAGEQLAQIVSPTAVQDVFDETVAEWKKGQLVT